MARTPRPPRRTLRADALALLQDCAGAHARLAARRITRFLDRELAATGFGAAQLGLMAQVATAADDRLGALARRAGVDPSTLSRTLRTLEAAGLVEIAGIEADQRRRAVWLTEAGVRRLEAALPVWRAAHAALAALMRVEPVRQVAEATDVLGA